jgi:hypothetical protein
MRHMESKLKRRKQKQLKVLRNVNGACPIRKLARDTVNIMMNRMRM